MNPETLSQEVRPHAGREEGPRAPNYVSAKKSKPNASLATLLHPYGAAGAILLHLLLRYLLHTSARVSLIPLFLILLFEGTPLVFGLLRRALRREFGSDLLAGMSILTAVALGQYLVASIVVLMLTGGAALEQYAARRASSVLDVLARRMPQIAHRKTGERIQDVKLEEVRVGDLLQIYPHEVSPADGTVVQGQGRMDESFLTGEPYELSKAPGSQIISGAINGETALLMRADKLPVDSRYARIMSVMEETEQRRPRLRRLGDELGAWYTPVALAVALLAWALTGESHRFLAVLVIATPCPLLIAIPVAIVGAISLSARAGIIIKNPAVLEQIDSCRSFIFDKTGTLTYGQPFLTDIECAPDFSKDEVLEISASLERYSKHPLATAVMGAAELAGLKLRTASEVHEPPSQGLLGVVGGRKILLTGRNQLRDRTTQIPRTRAGLECLVFLDGKFAAVLRFHDAPRPESRGFVKHLKPRHGVSRVMIVSGDRDSEVRYLAEEVGIREVHSAKSPEEKVQIVQAESGRGKTLYVGDGVNDAPAMQAATVGVAIGQNSDIAAEAADAVILESSIGKVDELIHIGRRMRSIAMQSALGGMALSTIGMAFAAFGFVAPLAGAIAQELIDLASVVNAIRVALPVKSLRDF